MATDDNSRMDRVRHLLELVIREAGLTFADVEQRLAWTGGTLSRLIRGARGLRVEQILQILDVAGMRASRFFAIDESFETLETSLKLRSSILNALSTGKTGEEPDFSDEELQRRIEAALHKMFKDSPPSG